MAVTQWTAAAIRAAYDEIAAADLLTPTPEELDLETLAELVELLRRELVSISTGEGVADAATVAEQITTAVPAAIYDVASFVVGLPTVSVPVLSLVAPRSVTFAADFDGSYAKARTTATSSAEFDVQKNGVSVGTITFATGVMSGTFDTSDLAISLVAGDRLDIIAPAVQDATLAYVAFTLVGLWSEAEA